ncbi:MAG: GNAT family N-acetyltransferase [Microbacteriaceae bacterium]|nr:GNAT family N-acetyltransferase [Microbacteriaceae bacterium]
MFIRDCESSDLPALIDLTISVFRPLFEEDLPAIWGPEIVTHDHPHWEDDYRRQIPSLHDPATGKFITLAEQDGVVLGYVGWDVSRESTGQLEMVAVRESARGRGIARALCQRVLDRMGEHGITVVHIGTGGDPFHGPARALYESLGFTGWPTYDYARTL